ncbi:MAG: hypothetical protein WA966_03230 [Ornithinimicrobium sp.]
MDSVTNAAMDTLWARYDDHVYRLARAARAVAQDANAWTEAVCVEVLTSFMGAAWVEDRIANFETCDLSKDYLDLGSHVSQVALRRYRVRELARRLYEFQSFEWFPTVVKGLGTRDIGPVAFELDALSLLMVASPVVGTRAEVSEKGKDFDGFALMRDVMVPVEVKAKSDMTPWTPNTVRNTVKGAARQLPKNEVGLLFVRIPYAWVGLQLEEEFSEALMEGTRQTTRLGAIIAVIDKPSLTNGDPVNRVLDYFREPGCPDHIWDFCMRLRQFWDANLTHAAPRAPF